LSRYRSSASRSFSILMAVFWRLDRTLKGIFLLNRLADRFIVVSAIRRLKERTQG
jgi:hypothetical protein